MFDLPFAENVNYWKTGQSSPDTWTDRTKRQIEKLGGTVLAEGYGSESITGRSAFMLAFEIAGDRFKVMWPVLTSKSGNEKAARVQAATMLYHDIKAKCISAAVLGSRAAFFSFLVLPDGRAMTELSAPELEQVTPAFLAPRVLGLGLESGEEALE
jgi:hypothetical protein